MKNITVKKSNAGSVSAPNHAAPQLRNPYLLHPRGGVGGRFGRFEYLEVHEVGRQEPDRDGQLVKRHECPAPARHGDLGNIHRRNDRHHADAHAAHDAVNDQLREVGTDGTADGRNGEQHGRQQHRQLGARNGRSALRPRPRRRSNRRAHTQRTIPAAWRPARTARPHRISYPK